MTASNRELLEKAAKAAKAAGSGDLFFQWEQDGKTLRYVGQREWNPITDDGDALRLAVKLRLQITPGTFNREEATVYGGGTEVVERVHFQQDPYAATRLAIVRAAAAMEGGSE